MKLAGGHLWPEQPRLQSRESSLDLFSGYHDALCDGAYGHDALCDGHDALCDGADCNACGGENQPGDLLNSRGNPDTRLLGHDVRSPPV